MLIHYPAQPLPDAHFELGNGSTLRELIKTAAANGISSRLSYNDGKQFHYTPDIRRRVR
jgi:hypothetical protein